VNYDRQVDLERVLLVLRLADGWTFRARSVKETKPAGTVCYRNRLLENQFAGAPFFFRVLGPYGPRLSSLR
jgi:hypothetical protein